MQCLKPLTAYRGNEVGPSGKRSIVFSPPQGFSGIPFRIPCGQCRVCRLNKSRETAICAVHESKLYEANCFLTLTYSPDKLPAIGSLDKSHMVLFLKRLRRKYSPRRIRYLQCGEYGDLGKRAHHHCLLFNFDFSDKKYLFSNDQGDRLYTSVELDEIWSHGKCWIGAVSFESAAYVGRYVTKKMNGPRYAHHYDVVDKLSGEILGTREKEYATMSQSLGVGWLKKFRGDVYPLDEVVIDGRVSLPPKRYDRWLEKTDPVLFNLVKSRRYNQEGQVQRAYDNLDPDRLFIKEEVLISKMNLLERKFENEVEGICNF